MRPNHSLIFYLQVVLTVSPNFVLSQLILGCCSLCWSRFHFSKESIDFWNERSQLTSSFCMHLAKACVPFLKPYCEHFWENLIMRVFWFSMQPDNAKLLIVNIATMITNFFITFTPDTPNEYFCIVFKLNGKPSDQFVFLQGHTF